MPAYDTDWPADSTEFCPHPSAQDIFVCGTYKLEQSEEGKVKAEAPAQDEEDGQDSAAASSRSPQKRRGKCLLFRAQDEENLCVTSRLVLV